MPPTNFEGEYLFIVDLFLHPVHEEGDILRGRQLGGLLVHSTITPGVFIPKQGDKFIQKDSSVW